MKFLKRLLKFILNKWVIFTLLILIQLIAVSYFIYTGLNTRFSIFYVMIFASILSILAVLSIVRRDYNPAYKISWIVLVSFLPIIGPLFYLIFGKLSVSHYLRQANRRSSRDIHSYLHEYEKNIEITNPDFKKMARYVREITGMPVWDKTATVIYNRGIDIFEAIKKSLNEAKKFIFIEMFIIAEGRMLEDITKILIEKAKKGVDVRFIYDDFGGTARIPAGYKKRLQRNNIQIKTFNPLMPRMSSSINYRDHRKIIVIDGNVAFTGGINLADEYINEFIRFGIWKDGGIRLTGLGVFNFTMMFLNMWEILNRTVEKYDKYIPTIAEETDGLVLPFPDGPFDGHQTTGNVYLKIISYATKYVYITTPYLILDNELLVGLKIAAMSGIDVRIITPHIPDKKLVFIVTKSYYRELIEAGVRIYQYTPGFIHTKSIIADDNLGIVGTANFDFRSLYLHFENSCLLHNNSSLIDLRNDFLETVAISQEISIENLKKEGIIKKFVLSILKVFSPLM